MAFEEYKSQSTVNAEQVEETRSVITPQGAVTALPGQWEVRYPDGNVRVLDDEEFQGEWGSGESGETDGEESQPTLLDASAESDTRADKTVSTADADSASDSSPDSDRVSETVPDKESATVSDKESSDKPPA
jgi:hypothetical protein